MGSGGTLLISCEALSFSFYKQMDSLSVSPAAPWPLDGRTMPSLGLHPGPQHTPRPMTFANKVRVTVLRFPLLALLWISGPSFCVMNTENLFLLRSLCVVVPTVGNTTRPDVSMDSCVSFWPQFKWKPLAKAFPDAQI